MFIYFVIVYYFLGELFLETLVVSCIDFDGICLYFIFSYTYLYVLDDIFEVVDFVLGDLVSGDLVLLLRGDYLAI